MAMIPDEVQTVLRGCLTAKGIWQWWTSANRYLGAARPCDVWPKNPDRVLEAARALDEGYYV
jgi:hypothetical protein